MIEGRQDFVIYLVDLYRSPFGVPHTDMQTLVYNFQQRLGKLLPEGKRYIFEQIDGRPFSAELRSDLSEMMRVNGYLEKVNERNYDRKYDWRIKTTPLGNLRLSKYRDVLDRFLAANNIEARDLLSTITA